MVIRDRVIYADEGKVLDFKKPHYALNEDNVVTEVHLYSPSLRMGSMDTPDNYIEVNIEDIEEE